MELEIILMGLAFIALCIFPFVYSSISGKNRKKNVEKRLNQIAVKNNCEVKESDCTGTIAIGIDTEEKFVFFFKKNEELDIEKIVDLSQVKKCEIQRDWYSPETETLDQKNLKKLLLIFSFVNSSKSSIFPFYDGEEDWQINGELEIAEKWKSKISKLLK